MNKKFFAALASATMAFTASGSIAVFADDFVEEKNPVVDNGDIKPLPETVVWNEDNFGALAKLAGSEFTGPYGFELKDAKGESLEEKDTVKTEDLKKVTKIKLTGVDGEIKGLEYFTGLTSFADDEAEKLTNTTLDFSVNTKLTTLSVTKAAGLTEITLPNPEITKDDKGVETEVYHLATLNLADTALTSLDISEQKTLTSVTVVSTKSNNGALKEVTVLHGTNRGPKEYTTLNFSNNNLETIDLANTVIGTLNLSKNHIGALDLNDTTATTAILTDQTFYVSETLKTVNLTEVFADFDKEAVSAKGDSYDSETGVLTIDGASAEYKYDTLLDSTNSDLVVKLEAANPMSRLYNPNSGEHFYTADIKEKQALVDLGWNDEGYGWVAPKNADSDKPVYRLYNPNAGDHHYTVSEPEKNTLVSYGWKYEGEGWKSAAEGTTPVYRQYNPYANGAGSHNYTTDKAENDYLVSLGWTPEGTAWFALLNAI